MFSKASTKIGVILIARIDQFWAVFGFIGQFRIAIVLMAIEWSVFGTVQN